MAQKKVGRNTKALGFSLYRYDSTGRIVHYGPEGEVLELDSAFQIIGVRSRGAEKSRSVSKAVGHVPQ
jgi:hypothetical protein